MDKLIQKCSQCESALNVFDEMSCWNCSCLFLVG